MKWFYKLERKYGRYAIPNLMYYIIILYAIGFVVYTFGGGFYNNYLSLNAEAILHGQIWRIFTFIIAPPNTSFFFIFFSLYFYYIIGVVLERAWGAFRFNMYFFTGMLLHVIAAIIIYLIFGVNFEFNSYYLNLSLFLAYATINPDAQLLLFFIIPIKIKWIAYFDGLYFILTILSGFLYRFLPYKIWSLASMGIIASPVYATAALMALLNFVVYFFLTVNYKRVSPHEIRRKTEFAYKVKSAAVAKTIGGKHKCAVCGRTEKDDENLVFRYCTKCEGNYEYCQEHLYTHQHVSKN